MKLNVLLNLWFCSMLAYADLKSKKCQSLDNSESKDERKMTWVDQTSRNLSQVTTIMPLFTDFISQNAERSGIDILEIGCGSGRALLETQLHLPLATTTCLNKKNYKLNHSEAIIQVEEREDFVRTAKNFGIDVLCSNAGIDRPMLPAVVMTEGIEYGVLPFQDQSFDLIYSVYSLGIGKIPSKSSNKLGPRITRLLKPGGIAHLHLLRHKCDEGSLWAYTNTGIPQDTRASESQAMFVSKALPLKLMNVRVDAIDAWYTVLIYALQESVCVTKPQYALTQVIMTVARCAKAASIDSVLGCLPSSAANFVTGVVSDSKEDPDSFSQIVKGNKKSLTHANEVKSPKARKEKKKKDKVKIGQKSKQAYGIFSGGKSETGSSASESQSPKTSSQTDSQLQNKNNVFAIDYLSSLNSWLKKVGRDSSLLIKKSSTSTSTSTNSHVRSRLRSP